MTGQPRWADSGQGDLLALVARGNVATDTADHEWEHFVWALEDVAIGGRGRISPNHLRRLVRGQVAPQRIGAFVNRALAQKLIAPTGDWEVSDDTQSGNGGKPARVYRWIGGAS